MWTPVKWLANRFELSDIFNELKVKKGKGIDLSGSDAAKEIPIYKRVMLI